MCFVLGFKCDFFICSKMENNVNGFVLCENIWSSSSHPQDENRFPLSEHVKHARHHSFFCNYVKHANTHSRVENPNVSLWPFGALDMRAGVPTLMNGAFLLNRGKPHTHTCTHNALMHAPRAVLSHHPTLQDSVNVRLWETGFILEQHDIFTPFITASVCLTYWHSNTWYFSESKISHPKHLRKPLCQWQNVSDKTLGEIKKLVRKV